MIVVCERCINIFVYDAERMDFEPFQCPTCDFINYVFSPDWK